MKKLNVQVVIQPIKTVTALSAVKHAVTMTTAPAAGNVAYAVKIVARPKTRTAPFKYPDLDQLAARLQRILGNGRFCRLIWPLFVAPERTSGLVSCLSVVTRNSSDLSAVADLSRLEVER